MELCERCRFLHMLPKADKQIVWTWQAENGTIYPVVENLSVERQSAADCFVELINICVAIVTFLAATSLIVKYKCSSYQKKSGGLLPFHTTRTLLCVILFLTLLLELCESFLVSTSLTTILTIIASCSCWILHRATETRDGLGTAVTGGGFVIIGLSRTWRLLHMCRLGLSFEHVRATTTAIVAICCGFLATIDSYTLYRVMQRSKRYTIRQLDKTHTSYKHSRSPFLSKITFHWIIDLLLRAYYTPLELQDLGDLPEEETARHQFERFRNIYENEKERREKGRLSLWCCFWKRIWLPFAAGGVFKLFGDAATLVGPMAISKIINHVYNTQNVTKTKIVFPQGIVTFSQILENGYVLGIVVFFAAILQSTLSQASTHILCVEGIRLKTALQVLVYDKALRICSCYITEEEKPIDKEKNQSRRQQTADIGTLTNLMAEDAYNVMSFFWISHYIWAIPLKITAIIYLLYIKLGISAIIGAICCVLIVTPMQLFLGKHMSENSKSITEKSDARLRLLNEILQAMKLVKLRSWESIFEDRVRKTRSQELKLLDKDSIYWSLINFLTHASSILTTLFTFGIYFWLNERNLDAGSVFTSLALFSQLTVPLFIFPVIVPIIINAMVSTTRLEEFLLLPEITNILPDMSEQRAEDLEDSLSKTHSFAECDVEASKVHSVTTFGSLDDIVEDEEDQQSSVSGRYSLGISSSIDTVFEKDPETPDAVVKVRSGVFSWGSEENQLITNDLVLQRGQLSLIVGKTGSGKTSLLLAILGEIQKIKGSVEWTKGLKIAYVSQRPWLLNATLRDNILFGSAYRPRRYRNVLRACALQPDVDILPGRDLTRIGEKGINLSGGQKQRVTIARAIYSEADVIIMDDPLSALDQQVGRHIFDYGVRRLLLRSGRTVIMVTHRLEFLTCAHEIIVMDGCRVRGAGTKTAIEESDTELAEKWRKAATRPEDENRVQKTAKDRWSLIRLVSRIGISVKNRHASDGSWITDQEVHVSPPVFIPLRMRRSTLSGSRYLAHDLTDLPVPSEEWNVVRKRSRSRRNAVRSSSLQPRRRPLPVLRQNSTPTILETNYILPRKRHNTVDNGQCNSMLGQFYSARIGAGNCEEASSNREKSIIRRLMLPNPSKSGQERDSRPMKRLLSVEPGDTLESNENDESNDELEEQRESVYDDNGIVTQRTWIDYPKAGGAAAALIYVVTALICQAVRVYTDLWLSRWTDYGGRLSTHSQEHTLFYFKVYMSLSVASILLSFVYNVAGQWAGAKARRKLHQDAISGLLRAPVSFFEQNPIGRILNRFSADVGVIDKKISTSIQRLTSFVLLCGSAILVNIIISPWFLIAALPTCAVYYFLQKVYRRGARQLQRLDGSTRGPVAAHFSETLSGLPILRASRQESRFMERAMKHLDANTNAFLILNTSSRWLGIALDYLGAVIVVAAIFTALISSQLYPDRVTPALVGLAINYTLLVPIYLNWVVKFTAEIEMYMGSVARISAYRNGPREDYRENGVQVPDTWPGCGEIVFENVSLRYDSQREPVIVGLSLKVPSGQKLGICGRTGSGKSSVVMALFRMIEICQGRVSIDGTDVLHVPLQTLRSRLSIIPQDVIMFSGTIRENLDPLSEHEDSELWSALELAQIKDVISSHPQGLNLEVREGGENFSIGQLQLLCMARAALRRSSVVILDEATSALDATTEKCLLKAAFAAFQNKTVIIIAHRPAALLDCDRIIVFGEGRIVEEGSPAELMQISKGFFSTMLKSVDHDKHNV